MAEIAGYSQGIVAVSPAAPAAEMVPNHSFIFPHVEHSASHRRLKSMNVVLPRPTENSHRRGASALPSFTFNASDTSGLATDDSDDALAQHSPSAPATPSRGSHKRNTSEYVGGFGMTGAINSSPTRSSALSVPRRQHRSGHSRSRLTLSSYDLSSIMSPSESEPRLSSSLPNTPLEHPSTDVVTHPFPTTDKAFGSPFNDSPARPPSRPRVEFSDNVEYIPRPLSTISSETGSSMSTLRGHSVNNSISSMLSLSNTSPPYARVRATSLETTPEDEPGSVPKSSLEVSRQIEKEGQWLRNRSVADFPDRPFTQPAPPPSRLTFAEESIMGQPRTSMHRKQRSVSNNLAFDRRKSEPLIGTYTGEPSRFSALSPQEQAAVAPYSFEEPAFEMDRRSSSRRLKDWAVSKLLPRKSKDLVRPASAHVPILTHAWTATPIPVCEPAVAETDLDAVFNLDAPAVPSSTARPPPVFDLSTPCVSATNGSKFDDYEDHGTMLDLDAALGPFKTPPLSAQRPRRELHSSRGTKDFVGPGGHYLPSASHRRTESAPLLTAFDQGRMGTPPQAAMADVFEEDEEDLEAPTFTLHRLASTHSEQDDEAGTGVQIVDSDVSASSSIPDLCLDDGLRIQREEWEPERPTTSYGNLISRLSTPIPDRRSSVIEDTIIEESSPTEPTIVESHEEPRAQSLTKSSDSSDSTTILATQPDLLALPDGQHQSETPYSYQSSAFSSPDMARRQGSFDTSRAGTSASSIADTRTMSSCTTGEPSQDVGISSDDIPSLTSSRSTMISTMHVNSSRRDVSGARTPSSGTPGDVATMSHSRRKRASIQSLSQLVGGSFGPRANASDNVRPQTAYDAGMAGNTPRTKEHRLKKLMFWKSKHRQAGASTIS